ncbi:ParB/RepB/Spo0J family partition protein [Hephaestia caeni]|uniref:ParB/RepB/Spo0J family partition protein n=1 Tax=Hephaestia caeni TaxID=645617 RepID=A0A397P710_9SPHN|nr:ParB N-terminal domain-containing protein [Hephaestia caeni]RIA44083.1 ParB/RepB/Spo0J family partition protein [Hephaestia caeni]
MVHTAANEARPVGGAALEENPVEQIVSIRVDQIDVSGRLREVDPVYAEMIAASLSRNGQEDPIKVCRLPGRDHWTLVVGAHRVEGARLAGIEYLKAIVVGAGRDERRRREVIENLHRRDLDPFDRAMFIAEEIALLKVRAGIDPEKNGRTASAHARWDKTTAQELKDDAADATATMAVAYDFTDRVVAELGFSRRLIERDLMLVRRLSASVVAKLREERHPILKVQKELLRLAEMLPDEQREAVEYLTWRTHSSGVGPVAKVAEAAALVRNNPKPNKSPEDKRLDAVIGAVTRMSRTERLGLVQSPTFQNLLPAEARDLLAPLRLDGENVDDA